MNKDLIEDVVKVLTEKWARERAKEIILIIAEAERKKVAEEIFKEIEDCMRSPNGTTYVISTKDFIILKSRYQGEKK